MISLPDTVFQFSSAEEKSEWALLLQKWASLSFAVIFACLSPGSFSSSKDLPDVYLTWIRGICRHVSTSKALCERKRDIQTTVSCLPLFPGNMPKSEVYAALTFVNKALLMLSICYISQCTVEFEFYWLFQSALSIFLTYWTYLIYTQLRDLGILYVEISYDTTTKELITLLLNHLKLERHEAKHYVLYERTRKGLSRMKGDIILIQSFSTWLFLHCYPMILHKLGHIDSLFT